MVGGPIFGGVVNCHPLTTAAATNQSAEQSRTVARCAKGIMSALDSPSDALDWPGTVPTRYRLQSVAKQHQTLLQRFNASAAAWLAGLLPARISLLVAVAVLRRHRPDDEPDSTGLPGLGAAIPTVLGWVRSGAERECECRGEQGIAIPHVTTAADQTDQRSIGQRLALPHLDQVPIRPRVNGYNQWARDGTTPTAACFVQFALVHPLFKNV